MSELWSKEVTVARHHIPEDESFEGGYEAKTMTGVPEDMQVKGADTYSAEEALEHLVKGLVAFGFRGRLVVHDSTNMGRTERYHVEV